MGIEIGDVWTTRVFRDQSPQLRVFKIAVFMGLSVGVIDQEDPANFVGPMAKRQAAAFERIIWFSKSDLQFLDILQKGAPASGENKN